MDMINYMNNNPGIFMKIANHQHQQRDSFRIGCVTAQNNDGTYDVKPATDTPLSGLNSMSEDKFSQGAPVIYLGGNCKTLSEILAYSPFMVTSQRGLQEESV